MADRLRAVEPRIGSRQELAVRLSALILTVAASGAYLPATQPEWFRLLIAGLSALLVLTAALPLVIWAETWAAFLILRGQADDIGLADRGYALLRIDTWLGAGRTPTSRLHEIAGSDIVDHLTLWIHLSYFVAPHLLALGLWVWGVRRGNLTAFWRFLLVTGGVMMIGLVLHALVPAAPPWLVAERGADLDIYRVVQGVDSGGATSGRPALVIDHNPLAAMPSLHLAITLIMALTLWRVNRVLGLAGMIYVMAMGFSLVYLGEHWFIDALVGVLLGTAATTGVERIRPDEAA